MNSKNALSALSALAHAGRLDLFRCLVRAGDDGLPVSSIADQVSQKLTTASAQLGVLSQSGLARSRREGRTIFYSANYSAVAELVAFIMRDCCGGATEVVTPIRAFLESADCCSPQTKEDTP